MARVFNTEDYALMITSEPSRAEYTVPSSDDFYPLITSSFGVPQPEDQSEKQALPNTLNRTPDRTAEGSVEINSITIDSLVHNGQLLAYVFGSESYDDTNDLHTLTFDDENPPKTYTMNLVGRRSNDPNMKRVAIGSVPESATLTIPSEDEQELNLSIDWTAHNSTNQKSGISVSNLGTPPASNDVDVYTRSDLTTSLTYNSRTIGELQEATFEFDNNTTPYFSSNADNTLPEPRQPTKVNIGTVSLSGTVTTLLDNVNLFDDVRQSSQNFTLNVKATKSDGYIDMTLTGGEVTQAEEVPDTEDAVETDIEMIFGDGTIEIEDQNSTSSYL